MVCFFVILKKQRLIIVTDNKYLLSTIDYKLIVAYKRISLIKYKGVFKMELTELNKALISIQGHINNAKNEIEDFQTNHNDDSDLLEQA